MRKIYATLVLSIAITSLFSQQTLVLKNFKYRINTYRAINYSLNSGSQLTSTTLPPGNFKNSSASGDAGVNYFTTKSTDKILLTATGGLNASFYSGKSETPMEENTSKSFSLMPRIFVMNKWFGKKLFTELGADVSTYYRSGKDVDSKYILPAKSKQGDYYFSINTGIGKGRLENITDMQNALWLYKDMEAEKLLSRSLTDEELNELGKAITKGNNTRVLDSRRRTQFVLKTVDEYFQQKRLLNKTDINYFVHLNDILFFAFNNPRLSGTEKFIRFTPSIVVNNGDVTNNNVVNKKEQRYQTQSLVLSTGIHKYIPVNLTKQFNYGAAIRLSYISKRQTDRSYISGILSNETKMNSDLKEAALNVFLQHAIYPNTRTAISFNLQSDGGYQDIVQNPGWYADVNLSASLNYFISYRTRFTCNAGASYEKNRYYYNNQAVNFSAERLQLYASAGLEISL